jgi:ribonuclease HII
MLTLGIDEAARGPVIGSMFIVGAMFEDDSLDALKNLGVKDSKMLLHRKRVELADHIMKLAKSVKIIEVTSFEIDEAVNGKDSLNLNWLEAIKQAELINDMKPNRVIIDCPSHNIDAYTNFLKERVNKSLRDKTEFIVQHKADQNFLQCSSASIVAKVAREEHIAELKQKIKMDFGSGYPSDPKTVAFIRKYWDKYDKEGLFRKSWETYKKIAEAKAQKTLFE